MIDADQHRRDEVSRALATGLVASLADRPFLPTAEQLHWVEGGGGLDPGDEDRPLARIAAGRYATLLAGHVVADLEADGAPGAYVLVMECARQAFLESLRRDALAETDVLRWENEGGAGKRSRGLAEPLRLPASAHAR